MNLSLQFGNRKPATSGWTAPIEDVKKQIGNQVERLVEVAGQVSRDVASQAGQATSDVEAKAGAAASAATSAAGEVPSAANNLGQRALFGARQLGKDLRAVRITTEPPRSTRPSILPGITLLGGLGAGLALMYFTDPVEGRHRRALLRGQLTRWTRMGRDKATATANDVRTKSMDLADQARKTVDSKTNDIGSDINSQTDEFASSPPDLQGVGPGNGWPQNESDQSISETTEHQVTSEIH